MSQALQAPPQTAALGATPGAGKTSKIVSGSNLLKQITRSYVVGLAIIAVLSIGIHVLLDSVISQQQDAATVINVAGRQRMLSQRIALFASDLHGGDPEAAKPLAETVAVMLRAENALVYGNDLGIKNSLSAVTRKFYLAGAAPLDTAVRTYIDLAQHYAVTGKTAESEADYRHLQRLAHTELLPALHQAVVLFETEANGRVDRLRQAQCVVLMIILIALSLEAMFIFRPLVHRVSHYAGQLYEMATRDALTGLFNRRYLMDSALREMSLAKRAKKPMAILMIDIDRFKRINDTHGHAIGDAVLQRFATTAQACLRMSDIIGRIGGEEFVVLLNDTTLQGAQATADKLLQAMRDLPHDALPAFTVSAGAAVLAANDLTFDDLLARADKALYRAKTEGRDRVVLAT